MRIVAILFGCGSVAFGIYYVWGIQNSPDVSTTVQRVGPALIGGLSIAAVSLVVTFFVDKKYSGKS